MRWAVGVPGAQRVPVSLSGTWSQQFGQDRWLGSLSAGATFVVLLLGQIDQRIFWAKSLPSEKETMLIELFLHLVNMDRYGMQPIFSAGYAFIDGLSMASSDLAKPPSIPSGGHWVTGEVIEFATLSGPEPVTLSLLPLMKCDVKIGRNHVWSLKPQLLSGVDEPLAEMLRRGRRGVASVPPRVS